MLAGTISGSPSGVPRSMHFDRDIPRFNVAFPKLVRFEDDLLVIEMTIVTRPFVLDFASAYLDYAPEFSDEIWAEWEAEKREQFENRWPTVQSVLVALEAKGIYIVDVSPSNIAFFE